MQGQAAKRQCLREQYEHALHRQPAPGDQSDIVREGNMCQLAAFFVLTDIRAVSPSLPYGLGPLQNLIHNKVEQQW
jgi:hypothetical protein